MSRMASASLDETAFPIEVSAFRLFQPKRLRHAVSAVDFRRRRRPGYGSPTDGKVLQQGVRAISSAASLPFSDISHNVRTPVSTCTLGPGKQPFSARHSPEFESCSVQPPDLQERAYLTPPEFAPRSYESSGSFPFPLNPAPLPISSPATAIVNGPQRRRLPIARPKLLTPCSSPDRYVSSRFSPQEPSKTFRLSRSPHQLSGSEKFLRHESASPDPFGPLVVPRLSHAGAHGDLQARTPPRSRLPGAANVLSLPQDALALQTRHASVGAIWNIGGNAQLTHTEPVRSVSNGRGGFISSGSNAPMYATQFFDNDAASRDVDRMEARLAAALGIDQTSRYVS